MGISLCKSRSSVAVFATADFTSFNMFNVGCITPQALQLTNTFRGYLQCYIHVLF